jgi:NitT/TauT family transport system permease protein
MILGHRTVAPVREKLGLHFARKHEAHSKDSAPSRIALWTGRTLSVAALIGVAYATVRIAIMLSGLSRPEMTSIVRGAGATFLRVEVALVLAAMWTIPVGLFIGLRPRVSAVLQPIAQIAASVPATALFPVILLILIRLGGGLGIGSIALLLLGTQWYLLFNVIAGASSIPTDLKEVCDVFHFGRAERWRKLLLPGIFPYLITGFVTASGGAWNASIVAEYFHFKGQTLSTTGLGSVISHATDSGNFRLLLAATIVMALMVVTINRVLWRRMYALAATRYKLDT